MAVRGRRVTVSTTAILLAEGTGTKSQVLVRNTDATNGVDLGGAGVTAGTGYRLLAGIALPAVFELAPGDKLYAIRSAAADVVVDVIESGF